MMTKILQIFLIQYFSILIDLFINTHTRVAGHSKTLIDNIFNNKPMLNITAGNIKKHKLCYIRSSEPIFN